MINYIWAFIIIASILYSFVTGNYKIINNEILISSKTCIDLILKLFPMIALWNGIVTIANKNELLNKFALLISPILSKLFKNIPKESNAIGYIASNIAVNMFGLGSAATPLGLKAMKELQKYNKNKDEASDEMITFLVLNTIGITLIPTTVISLRLSNGSSDASCIVLTSILSTFISAIFGLLLDYHFRKKRK